jgi:hypothetical protein
VSVFGHLLALMRRQKFVSSRLKLIANMAGGALKLVANIAGRMMRMVYEG